LPRNNKKEAPVIRSFFRSYHRLPNWKVFVSRDFQMLKSYTSFMDEIIANDLKNGSATETLPPTILSQEPQENITSAPARRKTRPVLQLLVIMAALCGLVAFGYFKNQNSPIQPLPVASETPQPQNEDLNLSSIQESSLSGKITRLQEDLGLFQAEASDINGSIVAPVYYDAGTLKSGEFAGYRRIVGVLTSNSMMVGSAYVFITKDGQKYLSQKAPDFPNYFSSNEDLFTDKVSLVDTFPTEHPLSIPLDDNYVLYRDSIPTRSVVTSEKDQFDQDLSQYVLEDTFPNSKSLNSPFENLGFFYHEWQKPNYVGELSPEDQRYEEIRKSYFETSTRVLVQDSTGLTYEYTLSTPKIVANYYPALEKFEQEYKVYQTEIKKYQAEAEIYEKRLAQGTAVERPVYPSDPERVGSPNLRFTKKDLTSSEPLMELYKGSFPSVCGTDSSTNVLKNIKQEDLKQIGTIGNQPVWVLADPQHPLMKYAYETKIANTSDEGFVGINKGATKPTYDAYIARNPLIIIKDYWGRFVSLGEWDYLLDGGCGKPVVYLYPETDTNVSVRFTGEVDLTTDIPDYHGTWNVLAHPNGILENLQTNNCSDPDFAKTGSEYAQEACQKNAYPYLFWAGNVFGQAYQSPKEGWVVNASELERFLGTKLTKVGLNAQESTDMLDYWLPKMRSEKADYYRVAFLQTAEMNALAPMEILPQPKTLFRIFLDWEPLTQKPQVLPLPQQLNTLHRQGFTVVEWGGLNR
jgi:hypothetical protein